MPPPLVLLRRNSETGGLEDYAKLPAELPVTRRISDIRPGFRANIFYREDFEAYSAGLTVQSARVGYRNAKNAGFPDGLFEEIFLFVPGFCRYNDGNQEQSASPGAQTWHPGRGSRIAEARKRAFQALPALFAKP